MRREVLLSPDAARQLRELAAGERKLLRDALRKHLEASDAAAQSRNRFRLRRPSPFADYELRVRHLRVFYRISGRQVLVVMIGRKVGNTLRIDGREFVL